MLDELALEGAGLAFRAGGQTLLEGASVSLRRGEVLGILGPNGAGKSTLLRLCAGLLRPSAGGVTLLGRPLAAWPARERARRLGYLPQHFVPHWDFSVREVLRLGMERGEAPASPAALGALAEAYGLRGLLDRRWSSLSGGERGRTLVASVLAPAPPVVLADEPAAALDVGHAVALMARLREQAVQGAAVAVVTHDLNLAAQCCDRLVVMTAGRVVAAGIAACVIRAPVLDVAFGMRFERLAAPDGRTVLVTSPAGTGVVQAPPLTLSAPSSTMARHADTT